MASLIFVRHGVADGASGRCIGHHDIPLTPDGAAAMSRLVQSWTGPAPAQLWSSDLARARASAAPFTNHFALLAREDTRLREMHFGRWEGERWNELDARDGDALQRWMGSWTTAQAPGGESFPELRGRVADWMRAPELTSATDGEGPVVVVAHAGSIRALLCHLLGLTAEQAFAIRLDHARATALNILPHAVPGAELLYANVDHFPVVQG